MPKDKQAPKELKVTDKRIFTPEGEIRDEPVRHAEDDRPERPGSTGPMPPLPRRDVHARGCVRVISTSTRSPGPATGAVTVTIVPTSMAFARWRSCSTRTAGRRAIRRAALR